MSNLQQQMLPPWWVGTLKYVHKFNVLHLSEMVDVNKILSQAIMSNLQQQMLPHLVSEDAEVCKQI